jgi:hypothetical protein
MNILLFNLFNWHDLLNFSSINPNIPRDMQIYLKLCSQFLEKKKVYCDIDLTKGYVILKIKTYKVKVNMLQYLLLEHIKINNKIKLENIESTLHLHYIISEKILNSLYQSNLITELNNVFTLNNNYSPTDDNEIIDCIRFFK